MNWEGGKMRLMAISLIIITSLGVWGAGELSFAGTFTGKNGFFTGPDKTFNLATCIYGTIGFSTIAYYMYKNSDAQRAKGYPEELGPGEWYFGGYMGVSYLPPTDWKFTQNETSNLLGPVAKNVVYQPGVLGGVKFGRYLDCVPWFGIEVETNFSRNSIRGNQGRISPPQPSLPANAIAGADWFMIWAMQSNFLFRYGILKDKEVPFGRLQPYVGIGPGFEIVYGHYDSTKNLAMEALAGLRYMFTEKVGVFLEYKFSYQFAIEYQDMPTGSKSGPNFTFTTDLPHHRFVLGVSYHFKNLFGN
jgi:opacity protein-like surface antigen